MSFVPACPRCVPTGAPACVLALILSLSAASPARAQVAPPAPLPAPPMPAPAPPGVAAPAPSSAAPDPVTTLDNLGAFAPQPAPVPGPCAGPLVPPASTAGYVPQMGFFDTIRESLFGDGYSAAAQATWTPLYLRTLFTDGWNTPWINPPAGSGGAPRQGWVNGFGGTSFRAWFFVFGYANDFHHDGNFYLGQYTIFAPLNRRFEFQLDVPFVVSNKGGPSNTYQGNPGDLTLISRLQLSETKDLSQSFILAVRMPTGKSVNGSGLTSLTPQYQMWYNIYGNWAFRGEAGLGIPTSSVSGRTEFVGKLALGRYWKRSEEDWLRQVWLYMLATVNTPITTVSGGAATSLTYAAITPGCRFQITGFWYAFAALEVPVTGPRPFGVEPLLAILKDY